MVGSRLRWRAAHRGMAGRAQVPGDTCPSTQRVVVKPAIRAQRIADLGQRSSGRAASGSAAWPSTWSSGVRRLHHHHATHVLRQSPGEQLARTARRGSDRAGGTAGEPRSPSGGRAGCRRSARRSAARSGGSFGRYPGRLYATTIPKRRSGPNTRSFDASSGPPAPLTSTIVGGWCPGDAIPLIVAPPTSAEFTGGQRGERRWAPQGRW